jgi:hypothetical protein
MATPPDKDTQRDPLDAFVGAHRKALNHRGKRFNAGEHAWLGSTGARRACEELLRDRGIVVSERIFEAIPRGHQDETLQYGEIVALSGDFYKTPTELFEEKSSLVDIPGRTNDLEDLRAIFAEEIKWIDERRQGTVGAAYPDTNVRLAWNAKSYVELALDNNEHFGWHNIVAYCTHHAEALRLAASARGNEDATFHRALYTNAFADHFLTDGFAAGHIRVPRAEIRAWAREKGWTEKVAGSLSKLLHDQDGHVDSVHGDNGDNRTHADDGLRVKNAQGTEWYTYCDGQLFLQTDVGKPAVEQAVAAVSKSVTELLVAWQKREIPRDVYEATQFVPFPHPAAPKLVEKFPAGMDDVRFEALWKAVAWYSKVTGVDRPHVRSLFAELPRLMEEFRGNVATAAADPTLRKRIAERYVAAYQQVG